MSKAKADIIPLARMRSGQKGEIVEINSGAGLRGPVLFQYHNTQAALGFGMACKVLVEVDGES